jgi:hypothetical protein
MEHLQVFTSDLEDIIYIQFILLTINYFNYKQGWNNFIIF